MKVPKLIGEFCSLRCADKWRNRYRRGIKKDLLFKLPSSIMNCKDILVHGKYKKRKAVFVSNQRFGMN